MTTEDTWESKQQTNSDFTTTNPEIGVGVYFENAVGDGVPLVRQQHVVQLHGHPATTKHVFHAYCYNDHLFSSFLFFTRFSCDLGF